MSKRDPLGVAIVGCGMISEFQAQAINSLPDARLVGFFNRTRASAEERSSQYGGRVFDSIDDLVADTEVEAVSICTPSGAHLEPALAAAAAGKHLMVEKPLEVTVERVDQIIEACRQGNVQLGAIFPRRFQDASRILKSAIDDGRFGTVSLADVYIKWYRSQEYYDSGGWRGTWNLDGGGALMNQGIHGIDLLQRLMGGGRDVVAFTDTRSHERIEVEDVASASVRFKNGALGSIEGSTGCWPGTKIRVEIGGSTGSVVMEDETFLTWTFEDDRPEDEDIRKTYGPREGLSGGGAGDPRAIDFEGHRRQFEDFAQSIREGRPPACDGREARAAVGIITGVYRAAKEGRVVTIDS
ncbi:MAG: Gfo/Idh/MocA family oxidoreductase [Planctomycetes bacterium]|nr:Gfo/Idh/MocA family oxidoreductase [Planctomycetota bacterium]